MVPTCPTWRACEEILQREEARDGRGGVGRRKDRSPVGTPRRPLEQPSVWGRPPLWENTRVDTV